MTYLPKAYGHQFARLKLGLHPRRTQIALAASTLVNGEIGCDTLRDVNLRPDTQNAHARRVRWDRKGAHAAQHGWHLFFRLGRRWSSQAISWRDVHTGLFVVDVSEDNRLVLLVRATSALLIARRDQTPREFRAD